MNHNSPIIKFITMEPKSTKQALADPAWLKAVKAKYDALINNDTFTLDTFTHDLINKISF